MEEAETFNTDGDNNGVNATLSPSLDKVLWQERRHTGITKNLAAVDVRIRQAKPLQGCL